MTIVTETAMRQHPLLARGVHFAVRLLMCAAVAVAMAIITNVEMLVSIGIFGAYREQLFDVVPDLWNLAAFVPVVLSAWPTSKRTSLFYAPFGVLVQVVFSLWIQHAGGSRWEDSAVGLALAAVLLLIFGFANGWALSKTGPRAIPWVGFAVCFEYVAGAAYSLVLGLPLAVVLVWVVGGLFVTIACVRARLRPGLIRLWWLSGLVGGGFAILAVTFARFA